jgi:catechol 2,3-dioxygenase-like lactoylglutathione lyase family enzyme
MKLNHVTLPAKDLSASIGFYQALGFEVIVKDDHYARLKNSSDPSPLSLELRTDGGDGAHVYFECSDLDDRVTALKDKGISFDSGPEDKRWSWREAWLTDPAGNRLCLYLAGSNRRFPRVRLVPKSLRLVPKSK